MPGKGKGIELHANTSKINAYKMELSRAEFPPAPMHNFVPLRSWPFCAHERQAEMDAYRNLPSATK